MTLFLYILVFGKNFAFSRKYGLTTDPITYINIIVNVGKVFFKPTW